MKKFAAAGVVTLAFLSASAFAQSGNISIPGVGKASGSTGSEVTNSKITVSNNSAKNVISGGGSVGLKLAGVEMSGMANVNSVNITGSKVKNSEIMVTGNSAEDIKAIGGTANVNSVNIN